MRPLLSADTIRRLDQHFAEEQEAVRKALFCKGAAKKRQLRAMEAKRNGRTTWNGGDGGIEFGAKIRALKKDITGSKD